MIRIQHILSNPAYKTYMKDIEKAEEEREFCLHGINHSLDVARIAYIINLEENLGYEKDMIYAMALLHDIGRSVEYRDGSPHHEAGVRIADEILSQASFTRKETELITDAISHHKVMNDKKKDLRYVLFKADKLSRNCFCCSAYDKCYWKEELKNKTIFF